MKQIEQNLVSQVVERTAITDERARELLEETEQLVAEYGKSDDLILASGDDYAEIAVTAVRYFHEKIDHDGSFEEFWAKCNESMEPTDAYVFYQLTFPDRTSPPEPTDSPTT